MRKGAGPPAELGRAVHTHPLTPTKLPHPLGATLTGRRRTSAPGWSGSSGTGARPAAAGHSSSAGPLTGLRPEDHPGAGRSPAWPSHNSRCVTTQWTRTRRRVQKGGEREENVPEPWRSLGNPQPNRNLTLSLIAFDL